MKHVAVTGASGNLGRLVVERLLRTRGVEGVTAIDRAPSGDVDPRVRFVEADVRDPEIGKHLAGADTLIHLAFIVEKRGRDLALIDSVNVGGTLNVFAAAKAAGLEHAVHASSIAVYGFDAASATAPFKEDAPLRGDPAFAYARTKAEVEKRLDAFEAEGGMPFARLRPSLFLGPRTEAARIPFAKSPLLPYLGEGTTLMHLTHEDDVAEAFVLAAEKRATGAFNVSTRAPLPIREWAEQCGKRAVKIPAIATHLADEAYRRGFVDLDPVWLRASIGAPIVVSPDRAERVLGWRPKHTSVGAVLRSIAGNPTARASMPVRVLLGALSLESRLFGGARLSDRQKYELRSIEAVVNLVLTGEHASEWRVVIHEGGVQILGGLDSYASATAWIEESTFLDMVRGKLKPMTAQMTGKIRFKGDGNLSMLLFAMIDMMRNEIGGTGPERTGLSKLSLKAVAELVRRGGAL